MPGPQFNQAAFSLSPEVPFSDPIRGEDGYYVMEYLDSQPSEVPPFDQVKDQVIDLLKQQRARDAAVKQGRELATKVKEAVAAGKSFSDACASLGLKPKTAPPFSIAQDTTNLPFASRIKDMALGMPTNAVSDFILTADGGMFFHVKQRDAAEAARILRRTRRRWPCSFLTAIARRSLKIGPIQSCATSVSIQAQGASETTKNRRPKTPSPPTSRPPQKARRGQRHAFTNSRKSFWNWGAFFTSRSGWNCTPQQNRAPGSSIASTIPSGERATTSKPRATRSTAW